MHFAAEALPATEPPRGDAEHKIAAKAVLAMLARGSPPWDMLNVLWTKAPMTWAAPAQEGPAWAMFNVRWTGAINGVPQFP